MFKEIEISEQVYEGGTPSKTITRADYDCASYGRKLKAVEASLPTNLDKGPRWQVQEKHSFHMSNPPTVEETCLLHGPLHST